MNDVSYRGKARKFYWSADDENWPGSVLQSELLDRRIRDSCQTPMCCWSWIPKRGRTLVGIFVAIHVRANRFALREAIIFTVAIPEYWIASVTAVFSSLVQMFESWWKYVIIVKVKLKNWFTVYSCTSTQLSLFCMCGETTPKYIQTSLKHYSTA